MNDKHALAGFGVPGLIAVRQNPSGQAKDIANEMLENVDTENLDKTVEDLGNKAKDALKSLGF